MESNTTLVQCYPAHEAVPDGAGPFPGVIVAHDAFGLSPHIKGIANRLSHEGFYALAPNFYALPTSVAASAPVMMRPSRAGYFEYAEEAGARERAAALSDERAEAVFRQAIGYATTRSEVRSGGIGLLGFGMGGRIAFLAACRSPGDVRACVCFAPKGIGNPAATQLAAQLNAPLLLVYAELDTTVSRREREAVRQRLTALEKDFSIEVFHDAGEDFFCEEREGYRVHASKVAWEETLAFLRRCL